MLCRAMPNAPQTIRVAIASSSPSAVRTDVQDVWPLLEATGNPRKPKIVPPRTKVLMRFIQSIRGD